MDHVGRKRKRPPTFHHFPEKRAKLLKKKWVENAKIKSKWKAQKRREGISTRHKSVDDDEDRPRESHRDPEFAQDDQGSEGVSVSSEDDRASEPEPEPEPEPERPNKRDRKVKQSPKSSASTNDDPRASTPSLRELTRQAYSPSSLHTYKSDPLHRRKGIAQRGRGAGGVRGRGQPNMKMRMNAMLEKIKRDYTA
ncbi:hypothetical protein AX16_004256 [Volvariella volvacea WC 439]|nr:hypothetical protein AX16_004256 [Volvariella volvacea WC 439]